MGGMSGMGGMGGMGGVSGVSGMGGMSGMGEVRYRGVVWEGCVCGVQVLKCEQRGQIGQRGQRGMRMGSVWDEGGGMLDWM